MADHVRKQLRVAVAAALTGLTTTGSRVYPSRVFVVQPGELPCLAVYTRNESDTPANMLGDTVRRVIQVVVEGVAAAESGLDNMLDQIAKEIESALDTPVTVYTGVDTQLNYEGCQVEMRDDLNIPVGSIALTFTAELYTSSPDVITGS